MAMLPPLMEERSARVRKFSDQLKPSLLVLLLVAVPPGVVAGMEPVLGRVVSFCVGVELREWKCGSEGCCGGMLLKDDEIGWDGGITTNLDP